MPIITDDAFNRNFEIGLLVRNTEFLTTVKSYFNSLSAGGTLSRLNHGGKKKLNYMDLFDE